MAFDNFTEVFSMFFGASDFCASLCASLRGCFDSSAYKLRISINEAVFIEVGSSMLGKESITRLQKLFYMFFRLCTESNSKNNGLYVIGL